MLSVLQKSSACKTVLKIHVNGLVSPQGMAFLDIKITFKRYSVVMYKLELNLELIKTNLKIKFSLKGKYYLETHMKPLCRKITSSIKELFYLRGNESFKGFFGNASYFFGSASYWIIKLMVSITSDQLY